MKQFSKKNGICVITLEEWIKTQPDKEHALKEFYAKCGIKY